MKYLHSRCLLVGLLVMVRFNGKGCGYRHKNHKRQTDIDISEIIKVTKVACKYGLVLVFEILEATFPYT